MSSFRITTFATLAFGVGLAAVGAIPPASAEPLMWWELGVTPSYGYGDDYPQRPREARAHWIHHPSDNEARARWRQ